MKARSNFLTLSASRLPSSVAFVLPRWVSESIRIGLHPAYRRLEPTAPYLPPYLLPPSEQPPPPAARQPDAVAADGSGSLSARDMQRWLGDALWRPEYAGFDLIDLMVRGSYDRQRSVDVGNEPVRGGAGWGGEGWGDEGRCCRCWCTCL